MNEYIFSPLISEMTRLFNIRQRASKSPIWKMICASTKLWSLPASKGRIKFLTRIPATSTAWNGIAGSCRKCPESTRKAFQEKLEFYGSKAILAAENVSMEMFKSDHNLMEMRYVIKSLFKSLSNNSFAGHSSATSNGSGIRSQAKKCIFRRQIQIDSGANPGLWHELNPGNVSDRRSQQ